MILLHINLNIDDMNTWKIFRLKGNCVSLFLEFLSELPSTFPVLLKDILSNFILFGNFYSFSIHMNLNLGYWYYSFIGFRSVQIFQKYI